MAKVTLDDLTNGVSKVQDTLNQNTQNLNSTNQFKSDGFLLPSNFTADGNGLPSSKVDNNRPSQLKRNIISWFIPEFGIVKMYVNPSNITYHNKKFITKDKTKGGFTLQYWGEDLTSIKLTGTTGSSGIEGINTLHEIYRAEQYAFDGTGLAIAANNSSADLASNLIGNIGGTILGMDQTNSALTQRNIPSLAQLAFTVEMYYNGWVYRGFFEDMTINEKAADFLIDYSITFTATQRRGYRTNYFPWSRSAKDGPSDYTTQNSFSGVVSEPPVAINAVIKGK